MTPAKPVRYRLPAGLARLVIREMPSMKLFTRLVAATALTLTLGSAASAKTLVYCSEGSPARPSMPRPSRSIIVWSNSSVARPRSSPASPRAGRCRRTGPNTPSSSVPAPSSTPPTSSRRRAISMPTTSSSPSSVSSRRTTRSTSMSTARAGSISTACRCRISSSRSKRSTT